MDDVVCEIVKDAQTGRYSAVVTDRETGDELFRGPTAGTRPMARFEAIQKLASVQQALFSVSGNFRAAEAFRGAGKSGKGGRR